MYEAEKLLAKMNPKTSTMEPSTPGNDALTPAMIAHAVAYIRDPAAQKLITIKGTGNFRELASLHRHIFDRVWYLAMEMGWSSSKEPIEKIVNRMVLTALCEELIETKCRKCRGRGEVFRRNHPVETCRRCEGTGKETQSERKRAQSCEIEWKNWRKRWAKKYAMVRSMLSELDSEARSSLKSALR